MKFDLGSLLIVSGESGCFTLSCGDAFDDIRIAPGEIIILLQDVDDNNVRVLTPIDILTRYGPRVTFKNWLFAVCVKVSQ